MDPEIPFDEKVGSFLLNVENFGTELAKQKSLDFCTFFYLMAISVRTVFATRVHSRTGMLTGTVIFAFGDF